MAAANLNTIRATIESRLVTELALSPAIPVAFNNVSYAPTPDSSWVQCLLNFGTNNYLTLGGTTNSDNRITGINVINIFTPVGVGSSANFTIAKRIRDVYNRINVSDVYFDAPIGPEVMSASPEGYFQTQVRVTFEFIEEL
jgi:hypothetical protein|tara:strand:+ start:215 stop:637 length:423 start_codon:yes stop_codon:yes gene_type:complete